MDLYVKLQGLKYNLEKVWGVFVKIPHHGNFWNYFPKEHSMELVHALVHRAHGTLVHRLL
jgi:hypothetical protein